MTGCSYVVFEMVANPHKNWDFGGEEEQDQHEEEDVDHAQDNANVEDEEPIDVLHGKFYLGFEILFND